MAKRIMANTGDIVVLKGLGLKGKILRIRFDDNADEIYTVQLDKPQAPDFTGLFVARHFELEFLT